MSENITLTPSTKRLERSSFDRVIAGVPGGLGRYFDLNPTFFRWDSWSSRCWAAPGS